MKNTRRICSFLLTASFLLGPVLHAAPDPASAKPLIVAATIFPLADIVRNITGKTARVIQILPAGASPHTFDLTPGKIGELQKARIVFKIGIIDDWIDSIAESAPNVPIVSLQNRIPRKRHAADAHDHGHSGRMQVQGFDPHYWLDARNGAIMAQQICSSLSALAPQHAAVFMQNCQRYQSELLHLDGELKKACSALKNRKLIVFHDGWNYFAAACGLEIIAVFQPAPGRDPAPRDLQKLYALAKNHGIKAVFSEPQLPTTSLEPLLEDLGLRVFNLDPLGGASPGDSYIQLLRRNVQSIFRADAL